MEKAVWVLRKSLIKRRKAKDLNLDFVPLDLEFVLLPLGFRSAKFGFPSGGIWISFMAPASLYESPRSWRNPEEGPAAMTLPRPMGPVQ